MSQQYECVDSPPLSELPTLPLSLKKLTCSLNAIKELPALPPSLTYIDCSDNDIIEALPPLNEGLTFLCCAGNSVSVLPKLPQSLTHLDCNHNEIIDKLPALPQGLTFLSCRRNQITKLEALPEGLTYLNCGTNQITKLEALPEGLKFLKYFENPLAEFPVLPLQLEELDCSHMKLEELPPLPESLIFLDCSYNYLTEIHSLPPQLKGLNCNTTQLFYLPELPRSLEKLDCGSNQLAELPNLPLSLRELRCAYNQLSSLDVTGLNLQSLDCSVNNMGDKSQVAGFEGEWDNSNFYFGKQQRTLHYSHYDFDCEHRLTNAMATRDFFRYSWKPKTESEEADLGAKTGAASMQNLKPCKIYNLSRGVCDAFLTEDNYVLVAGPKNLAHIEGDTKDRIYYQDEETIERFHKEREELQAEGVFGKEPAKTIDHLYLYTPENATVVAWNLNHDLLPFAVDEKWGYCNKKTGEVILKPQWDFCDKFYGDYARFGIEGEFDEETRIFSGKLGYIDFHGNTKIPPTYQYLNVSQKHYGDGFYAIKNNSWGVIDINERFILAPEWRQTQFCNFEFEGYKGFLATKVVDGSIRYTVFDKDGNMVIENLSAEPVFYRVFLHPYDNRFGRKKIGSFSPLIRRGNQFGVIRGLFYRIDKSSEVGIVEEERIEVLAEPTLPHQEALAIVRKSNDEAETYARALNILNVAKDSKPLVDSEEVSSWKDDNVPQSKRNEVIALLEDNDLLDKDGLDVLKLL